MKDDHTFSVSYDLDHEGRIYMAPIAEKTGKFSSLEIRHLLIAMGALILAMTIMFTNMSSNIWVWAICGGIATVVVSTGFLMHELAHKFQAQKYGCWAEFRMSPQGLMMAVFMALLGFLLAAPGAVMIRGNLTNRQSGIVSALGPLTNIIMASIFIVLLVIVDGKGLIGLAFFYGAMFNSILAGFNLIPFGIFDGKKIMNWNVFVWVVLVASAAGLLVLVYPSIRLITSLFGVGPIGN